MINRTTRLRFRRRVRSARRTVDSAQATAAEHLERHVVRRWQKFADVRRFVLGWLLLIGLLFIGIYLQITGLRSFYIETVPTPGGIYTEGVTGRISNLNPLFASSQADKTASSLIFEPLLRYDNQAQLIPALAQSWTVSENLTEYTLTLRDNLFWHDGTPLSAKDVKFTFDLIQHPDTQSPLNKSWQGITITQVDENKILFQLPNAFSPFLHGLTRVGILPSHILQEVQPKELRSHPFNLAPKVGSGPFSFSSIVVDEESGQIRLTRYERYYRGAARLDELIILAFDDQEQMLAAYTDGQITGAAGLRVGDIANLTETSQESITAVEQFNNVMLFFNMSDSLLSQQKMREALLLGTNRQTVFDVIKQRYALSTGPLLSGQLGFNDKLIQPTSDVQKAAILLEELGWTIGDNGLRFKNGQPLTLTLVTQNTDEYPQVAEAIQQQWRELGITLKLEVLEPDSLQQDRMLPHSYQLLLIGIEEGVDPDVFVFWHSSEARVAGLNLSEYKNELVDAALESGRTKQDNTLRIAKYELFLREWQRDIPAIALYRPAYFYAQNEVVNGFRSTRMLVPTDRFVDVHEWTILTRQKNKQL